MMSYLGEMLTFVSRIQLKHKIILLICLTLSFYTIITSETISLLIGFHRYYNRNAKNLLQTNWDRIRGFRTVDTNGNLLYYHLPNLTDYHIIYFYKSLTNHDNHMCHMNGTNWNDTTLDCVCNQDYEGPDCGIPSTVFSSINALNSSLKVERLSKPKRLVLSVILYTIEDESKNSLLDLINETLKSLSDFIDLFIITEIKISDKKGSNNSIDLKLNCGSNETNVNISANCEDKSHNKWLHLKDLLTSEENRFSDIILYSAVNLTTKQVMRIGANGLHLYIMSKVWTTSIRRVTDFRPNDMIIYMSSNTFPLKEILMFLKHYTGYPEPIKLISNSEKWPKSVKSRDILKLLNDPTIANNNRLVNIAVTFEYLSLLCRYDFKLFKNNLCVYNEVNVSKFNETYWPINYWTIGHNTRNGSANIVIPLY